MVVEPFATWPSSPKKVETPSTEVPKATVEKWTASYADADAGSLGLPTAQQQAAAASTTAYAAVDAGSLGLTEARSQAADAGRSTYEAADAGSLGLSTRKTEDQLIRDNAPVLVLPKGQYNLPGDPQDFIDNSRLVEERSATGNLSWRNNPLTNPLYFRDRVINDNTNDAVDDDFKADTVGQSDNPVYLDLDDSKRGQLGDRNAPIHYQTEQNENGDTTRITYWFFYAYNEGPGVEVPTGALLAGPHSTGSSGSVEIRQNHEGDFERITVEIDPATQEATHVVFSAHEAPHDRVAIGSVDIQGGHPVVYVADGSHGSYVEPATDHHTSDPTGTFKDRTAIDTNGDGRVDQRDEDVVVIDTSESLQNVEEQGWYPDDGAGVRWGEIGSTPWTNGPEGPSKEKAHVTENG